VAAMFIIDRIYILLFPTVRRVIGGGISWMVMHVRKPNQVGPRKGGRVKGEFPNVNKRSNRMRNEQKQK